MCSLNLAQLSCNGVALVSGYAPSTHNYYVFRGKKMQIQQDVATAAKHSFCLA